MTTIQARIALAVDCNGDYMASAIGNDTVDEAFDWLELAGKLVPGEARYIVTVEVAVPERTLADVPADKTSVERLDRRVTHPAAATADFPGRRPRPDCKSA